MCLVSIVILEDWVLIFHLGDSSSDLVSQQCRTVFATCLGTGFCVVHCRLPLTAIENFACVTGPVTIVAIYCATLSEVDNVLTKPLGK